MADLLGEIRQELEAPLARGTRWGTAVIGAYYLLLAATAYASPVGWRMQAARAVTLAAGAGLLGIAVLLRRPPAEAGRSESMATLGVAMVLVQVLCNVVVRQSWIHTSDLMILLVAMAFIVRRGARYFGLLLAGLGTWWIAAAVEHAEPTLHHWAIGTISAALASVVLHFHLRRMGRHQEQLLLRDRELMEEKDRLVEQFETALESVKTLEGLIPICSHCKKIRNDDGFWEQVESYVRRRTDARFSHGICPECLPAVRAEVERIKADSGPVRNLRT